MHVLSQGVPTIRFYAAALLVFTVISTAKAQTNQAAEPSHGQTLLNGLIGKNQTASSGKTPLGETKEQHDHYIINNSDNQPITSDTVRNNTDD